MQRYKAPLIGIVLVLSSLAVQAKGGHTGGGAHYATGKHSSSHGGHYQNGSGKSHKGGTYRNSKTGDKYGRHKN